MKRNPKPFSVEIKKSRNTRQHRQFLPRRLLEATQIDTTEVFREEEPQAVPARSAAPRILPSIVQPMWSNSEAAEPACRKSSPRSKPPRGQIAFNVEAITSGGATDSPAETPMMLEAVSQADASPVEEAASPTLEVQVHNIEGIKTKPRKPRKRASKIVEPMIALKPVSQQEATSEAQVMDALPVPESRQAGHHRRTRRQAAAAQLPRHERWKGRLHPAAW
jgi:hypothetical protein